MDCIRDIIENYFEVYNLYEIERMVEFLYKDIIFRNIFNGEMIIEIRGI